MIEIKVVSDDEELYHKLTITPDVGLSELCRCLWRLENAKTELLELMEAEFKPSTKFSSEESQPEDETQLPEG